MEFLFDILNFFLQIISLNVSKQVQLNSLSVIMVISFIVNKRHWWSMITAEAKCERFSCTKVYFNVVINVQPQNILHSDENKIYDNKSLKKFVLVKNLSNRRPKENCDNIHFSSNRYEIFSSDGLSQRKLSFNRCFHIKSLISKSFSFYII